MKSIAGYFIKKRRKHETLGFSMMHFTVS